MMQMKVWLEEQLNGQYFLESLFIWYGINGDNKYNEIGKNIIKNLLKIFK